MHGQLDIWQILLSSGWVVKSVLLSLVFSSVVSWTIIFQKWKQLKRVTQSNESFLQGFYAGHSLSDIFQLALTQSESTFGVIYKKGYEEITKLNDKLGSKQLLAEYFKEKGLENVERALKHGFNSGQEKMEEKNSYLASIGSITPFVGLLGTVWGIIDAFSGLSQGGGSIEAVAPGIAEALVATAVGLAAAIPAVLFFNHFNSVISSQLSQMESFCQDFLNLVERSLLGNKREN